MKSDRPSPDRDRRTDSPDRTLEDLVAVYVDRLTDGEKLGRHQILAEEPEYGLEILENLEAFVDLGRDDHNEPLGTLGDYTLRRQIGRGGMGVVYEAWENSMDRAVALKVLPAGVAADSQATARFLREAQAAGKLSHPNVVPVYFTGVREQTPFYAMEFVDGDTLAQILARTKAAESETETPFGRKDRPAYFEKLAECFADVADGLQHAHSKGVTHRDIKPSNLILDSDGRLRILDFGLARLEGQESLTLSGDFVGTPLYMSPEQARRKKIPVDHRTDVYSLGATMYEAICGQPPFRGKDYADTLSQIIERDPVEPRKINPRVPKDLETIVLKCLRREAANRYGTAEALGQDLRRLVRGDPIEARPQSEWVGLARRFRRHRTSILVACGFAVLLLVATWLSYSGRLADRARRILEYEQGVREAVVQLTAGQFSGQREWNRSSRSIDLPPGLNLLPLLGGDAGLQSVREAAQSLRQLTASLPDRIDAHYHLARAYRLLGQTEVALAELERVLEIDPDFVPARELAREIDKAAVSGSAKSREDFEETDWRRKWLEADRARKKTAWRDAAEAYTELLEVRPEPYNGLTIEAYLGRGVAWLELGQYEQAQEDLSVLRDRAPGCIEAVLLLGKAYLGANGTGPRRRGEALFAELYDAGDSAAREETALWIALVYASLQEFGLALEWTEPLEPTAALERLRSYLYRQLRQFDEATRAARRAIATDPDSLEAHVQLGLSLLNQLHSGRRRDADVALELGEALLRALELEGQHQRARSLLRAAWDALILQLEDTSRRDEMIDLRTRMSEAALAAGIVLSTAGFGVAQDFYDDFEDGDVFDGSPVQWGPEAQWSEGIYDASSGDLVIGSNVVNDVTLPAQASFSDTVSVRTQLRIPPGVAAGVFFGGELGGAYVGFIWLEAGRRSFRIQRWDGDLPLPVIGSAPLSADFDAEEDHLLQLDVRGDLVEMRVWRPGEPFPEEPLVSAVDTTYRSGNVGIDVRAKGIGIPGTALATYRFVQASSTMLTHDGADPIPTTGFIRGDCNDDGTVDVSDAVFSLGSLFLGEGDPACDDACDSNDDGAVDISDAIVTLGMLFLGNGAIPPPGNEDCGVDLTDDQIGCDTFEPCP